MINLLRVGKTAQRQGGEGFCLRIIRPMGASMFASAMGTILKWLFSASSPLFSGITAQQTPL
jgi:hypothetical protein